MLGFFSERSHKSRKNKIRRQLSQHLFSVSTAEQASPTHRKLRKGANRKDAEEFVEYRMELRKKWITKFFQFRPEIDPKVREELTKEAYEDSDVLKQNIISQYTKKNNS